MKNLSDFKKRIAKGVKLHTTFHQATNGRDETGQLILIDEDKGIREVNIVQSNSFTLLTPKKDDPSVLTDSWCSYPKTSEFKVIDDNTVLILTPDFRGSGKYEDKPLIPVLTYKFV